MPADKALLRAALFDVCLAPGGAEDSPQQKDKSEAAPVSRAVDACTQTPPEPQPHKWDPKPKWDPPLKRKPAPRGAQPSQSAQAAQAAQAGYPGWISAVQAAQAAQAAVHAAHHAHAHAQALGPGLPAMGPFFGYPVAGPVGAPAPEPYADKPVTAAAKRRRRRARLEDPQEHLAAQPVQPSQPQPEDGEPRSTVMLRNIPNKYTQRMLLHELESRGFAGSYDFFYLPIDFRNRCNVGYAFVNFTQSAECARFFAEFTGAKLGAFKSNKVCEVSWARVQGQQQNVEHYRNSPVTGIAIPQYRPILFDEDGSEVPFPDPDKPLPAVRLRQPKGRR